MKKEKNYFPIHWLKERLFKYKYPPCCVIQFMFLPQFIRRNYNTISNKHGYAPCFIHRFIFMKKCHTNNKQMKTLGDGNIHIHIMKGL